MTEVRRWTLTRANIAGLFELVPGKCYFEADGSVSGLSVFTPAGKVKAAFGDAIVQDEGGRFHVERVAR